MKILLIVKSKMMETLGTMYLSAVIKRAGHEATIVDLPSAYDYAIKWEPDIIGYSILTGDREKFKSLNERLKKVLKFKSIVGNCDPTFFPEGYDWADEICKGEGEQWISNYLDQWNRLCVPYDIDSIPWPDRTDFPNVRVRDFISSRGCPYKCTYCYNAKWAELFPEYKGVRVRNPKDVVAEIKAVNPEYVFFQDSCFGVDMKWMSEFTMEYINAYGMAKRYRTLNEKKYPPYQCNLRPELITEERVRLLVSSNCVAVRMALETASGRLRDLVGRKGYDLGDIKYASELLKKSDIQFMIQNIIGIPSATIEDDLLTLKKNIEYQPTYSWVSIYQPYPGTVLGDQCKEMGWYTGDYSDITDSFFETSHLEISPEYKEQLEILQKIFAMCVGYKYLPAPVELTYQNLPNLIHTICRKDGDSKLYLGLLK